MSEGGRGGWDTGIGSIGYTSMAKFVLKTVAPVLPFPPCSVWL